MSDERFEQWAIVELFGHARVAGLVTEQTVGGCAFVRVDVPMDDGDGVLYTRLLGQGAIYSINFVDEGIARQAARIIRSRPVQPYEVSLLRHDEQDDDDEPVF